jgi:hypothetical protein
MYEVLEKYTLSSRQSRTTVLYPSIATQREARELVSRIRAMPQSIDQHGNPQAVPDRVWWRRVRGTCD